MSFVHGDTKRYPTAALTFITTKGKCGVNAGVVDTLPVNVLIGKDYPIFHVVWQDILGEKLRETHSPRSKSKYKRDTAQVDQDVKYMTNYCFWCRTKGCSRGDWDSFWEGIITGQCGWNQKQIKPDALTRQHGVAQLNDPTLTNALINVRVVEGVNKEQGHLIYPYFAVKKIAYFIR